MFGYFCQLALQGKKNLMRKRIFRVIMRLAILLLVILSGMLA